MALGAFGGGLVLCLVVQFLLNRIIVRPLRRAVKVIGRIALGDTSEKLPMGKAVSCSEIMGCGESRCPSYGTTDHCWVTSGSFAAIRHCSRARKVEDCRDCPVYGAHDELEELGSIINALSDTLGQRKELARHIADGDLTHEVALASDQDAFGEALQDMTGSLRQVLGQVQAVGNKIAASSTHVSNTSQALSQGATQQAGSLEEISSSMVEQGAQTRQNAENASQANLLAAEAGKAAEKGNGQMKAMIEAMGQINESGQAISKIIRTIDDIAFQTNLLALNAAVEAARAGQHGKGFAVVAEEVRNLATRSARAARETSELIEGAVEKTRNGTQIADQTDETLGEIVAAVAKVTNLVAEIASSSSEQSLGIDDVNQRLGQIDQVTQQNAANAEEGAEAAVEMAHQAEQLRQQLARFSFENSRAGNALTASEAQEDTVGLLPSGGEGQG
jgi:methyl-accepting chemotaxis protein